MFLALAMLLGLRHAAEPDHLAAVSTLVAGGGSGRRAAVTGAWWGLGHALSLLAVGALLLLARTRMPGGWENAFEGVVSAVLILLGVRSLLHASRHARGIAHAHGHGEAGDHVHEKAPLYVGLIHGLAGSGALTAIALASMPSLARGLVFIAAFGAGAALGMALLAGLAGAAIRKLATPRVQVGLERLAGALSIALGLSRLIAL
jgi:ABC-type nickel/cobalt efflux system permease component RcnA